MQVVKRPSLAGHKVMLKLSKRELETLRRAEAIAEQAREIAARYEGSGGEALDLELAQAEHGPGSLADEVETHGGLCLQYVVYEDPVFTFKGG